jgi:hypothetical protein
MTEHPHDEVMHKLCITTLSVPVLNRNPITFWPLKKREKFKRRIRYVTNE